MKHYAIGLIIGILLTASTFMFIGSNSNCGRWVELREDGFQFLDTKNGVVAVHYPEVDAWHYIDIMKAEENLVYTK